MMEAGNYQATIVVIEDDLAMGMKKVWSDLQAVPVSGIGAGFRCKSLRRRAAHGGDQDLDSR
jgi:hypothetical protein